jgi:hypothetical protein
LMSLFFWLATQPLWIAATIMIGGGVLISVAGTLVVNTLYLPQELIQNNLLGGFKFAFLSSIYAGYLGLLLYGVYQQYEQTRGFIDLEVTQLTQLDRMAVVLPKATRDNIRESLKDYARTVIDVEWPELKRGHGSSEAGAALDNLFYVYLSIQPVTDKEKFVMESSVNSFLQIRENRQHRIRLSGGSLNPLLWGVALLGAVASIIFPWFFGGANITSPILMSTLLAALTMSVLLVILKLSYPFVGEFGILPVSFQAFL